MFERWSKILMDDSYSDSNDDDGDDDRGGNASFFLFFFQDDDYLQKIRARREYLYERVGRKWLGDSR